MSNLLGLDSLKKMMLFYYKDILWKNGVATKYLDNYVNYFREVSDNIDIFSQLLNIQGFYRVASIKVRKINFENVF